MATNVMERTQVIDALAAYRNGWNEVEEPNLIEVECSVALVLLDVLEAIGLTQAEQAQVMGQELYTNVVQYVDSPTQ